MLQIPLQAVPSQFTKVVLGNQNFQILLQQKEQGLFVDVNVDGADIVTSVIARDNDDILCRKYTGVVGSIKFYDLQGSTDPHYTGLNSRYVLMYE